ncbi:MAG TPA: hypothetical protein VEX65_09285, partial [Flavisolibacter sp.]|nr:hypothetical protein [Flavisolibacter sp.]
GLLASKTKGGLRYNKEDFHTNSDTFYDNRDSMLQLMTSFLSVYYTFQPEFYGITITLRNIADYSLPVY